jgi:hypothetical protein
MSLPDNLGVAIVERFHATPALVAGFTGGIYRSKANGKPDGSQLIFRVTNARVSFASPGTEFVRKMVRFTCLSGDSNEADRLRQLVEDAYGGQPLAHQHGWTTRLFVSNESEDEVTKPADPANMAYKSSIDFEFNEHQGA